MTLQTAIEDVGGTPLDAACRPYQQVERIALGDLSSYDRAPITDPRNMMRLIHASVRRGAQMD